MNPFLHKAVKAEQVSLADPLIDGGAPVSGAQRNMQSAQPLAAAAQGESSDCTSIDRLL